MKVHSRIIFSNVLCIMDTWGKLYSRIPKPSREGEAGSASGQWNEGVLSLKHTSVRESGVAFLGWAPSGGRLPV